MSFINFMACASFFVSRVAFTCHFSVPSLHSVPLFITISSIPLWPSLPGGSDKESACTVGDLSSIPALGRPPEERYWKRVFAMTSAFSWQNSIRLCPASFHISRPNLPVTPSVSWLPTFAFYSPELKGHLFWVLVLKGLVGLHRTIQLQLLQHYWLGHRLELLWYWMVCLRNEQRSFCRFWDCIQVLHFRLFCWPWWLLHFF